MRVLVDINVILSEFLFPNGQAAKAFSNCIDIATVVICSYVMDEAEKVIRKKFPERIGDIQKFFESFAYEFVYTPDSIPDNVLKMRDENDIPILYTAKREHVDIILTGDKDFTSLNLDSPKILSPSEFLTVELKQA